MATCNHALRRLMKDQEELLKSPVLNVSAAPLESNVFEWHCNIQDGKNIYHLILYFPQNYPYSSPSAEFVPSGFNYNQGAVMRGKKGDKICLSIFSDFADAHTEWADDAATGWSPGYTAQTVLLNVVSFLAENNMTKGPDAEKYQKFCREFNCNDCGHSFRKPSPSFSPTKDSAESGSSVNEICDQTASNIVDYISKERFKPSKAPARNDLFGYGLAKTQRGRKAFLTTPCEFLTAGTFYGMKKATGVIHSVMKTKLSYFLPLYINRRHGSQIQAEFEKLLSDIIPLLFTNGSRGNHVDAILELIPNLMCSTVVEFSKGLKDTSENSLQGYFALHRLFLWAMEIYPDLETLVETKLSSFITNPRMRTKDKCPDIGQWLMLLSVSSTVPWSSVAEAYLSECFKRNVMWYLKTDEKLADLSTSKKYRLTRTFKLTEVSRNLLTFQVAFLQIAKPDGMKREDILERYEQNLGFPTLEMVTQMKTTCRKIDSEIKNYNDWYMALALSAPTNDALFDTLVDSVRYAQATKGYFFTARQPPRAVGSLSRKPSCFQRFCHSPLPLILFLSASVSVCLLAIFWR